MEHLQHLWWERVYVRTTKFITCSQACDENDYMLIVEKLIRNLHFGGDDSRKNFALAIAVNRLGKS